MTIFKKTISVVLAVLMALSCFAVLTFAKNDEIEVTLRIEGISQCLYYGKVTVEAGSTVLDVVEKADELDENLSVTVIDGYYGAYISAVNGEKEKTFKGWDGWLWRLNDYEPSSSMDSVKAADGDSIIVYYGDPYGVGMQYPVANTDALADGKISFTSLDTVYDENGVAETKEAPVLDYKLIWTYSGGKTVVLTPDENGVCTIDEEYLNNGNHKIQIERTAANGCPTVLRFAPDYTVNNLPSNFFARLIYIIRMWISTLLNTILEITGKVK